MAQPRSRFPAYPPDLPEGLQLFLEAIRKELEKVGVQGGASIVVMEGGTVVSSAANVLDFASVDFDLTHSPAGEVNISISSGISRVGHIHDAADITTGIFLRARLPSQVAYEDEANTFTLQQTLSGGVAAPLVVGTDPGGSAALRIGGDARFGSLGVFDSADTPSDQQLLVYKAGATNKWQAESVQFVWADSDFKAALLADSTAVTYVLRDPGSGTGTPAAPPTPTVYQDHLIHTLEIQGYTKPAGFRYFEWEYCTGASCTGTITLATTTSTKLVHSRLSAGTVYRYKVRAVGASASAFSALTADFTAQTNSETHAFGAIIAGEIAVANLAAINANIGIITAGIVRNSGNTVGLNLGGAGGIPGTWTSGINFEAAAGSGSMTRYINFTATGANPVFKHEKMSLNADGTATFFGIVDITVPTDSYSFGLGDISILLRDTDVAHGMTTVVATDVYAVLSTSSTSGGLILSGFAESTASSSLVVVGSIDTSGGSVPVAIAGWKKSGTGRIAVASTDPIVAFWAGASEKARIRGDGTFSTSGFLIFTTAASKVVPGATSLAFRNNADSADNIFIADGGAVTFRSTVGGITTLTATTLAGTLSTAAQPNVTSLGALTGLTVNSTVFVNDASNGFMTLGVTIDQGANSNQILAFNSSSIAHGMTSFVDTDTYAYFAKYDGADGGLEMVGLSETIAVAFRFQGIAGVGVTTKSTAALAPLYLFAQKKSGTATQAMAANENLVVVSNQATTRFILDADGDSHQDVGTAWTNFDEHDDIALLTQLSVNVARENDPLRQQLNEWVLSQRAALERLELVTFNGDGHHFVNMSRLSMLLVGAVRQLHQRLENTEQKLLAH